MVIGPESSQSLSVRRPKDFHKERGEYLSPPPTPKYMPPSLAAFAMAFACLLTALVHGAPSKSEYVWSPPQVLQAASAGTGSLPACAMAPLPAGSHIILVNRNTRAEFQLNGMYRRMAAVLEALTSQGLDVHLVFHERSEASPTSMPRHHVYSGTMWEQYHAAKVAAGKQLRLGVVFATALTTRLERQLAKAPKRNSNRTLSYEESWDGRSLSALFKETEFTDEWPEEAVVNKLHHDGLPVAVVTDDIHYKRAPYAVETSVCKRDTGCASVVEEYFKRRELSLYASAQLVFTVTMEVRVAWTIRSACLLT